MRIRMGRIYGLAGWLSKLWFIQKRNVEYEFGFNAGVGNSLHLNPVYPLIQTILIPTVSLPLTDEVSKCV